MPVCMLTCTERQPHMSFMWGWRSVRQVLRVTLHRGSASHELMWGWRSVEQGGTLLCTMPGLATERQPHTGEIYLL